MFLHGVTAHRIQVLKPLLDVHLSADRAIQGNLLTVTSHDAAYFLLLVELQIDDTLVNDIDEALLVT